MLRICNAEMLLCFQHKRYRFNPESGIPFSCRLLSVVLAALLTCYKCRAAYEMVEDDYDDDDSWF